MGWCAIEMCDNVWKAVKKYIPKEEKQKAARKIYNIFRNRDMDDFCGDTSIEKACKFKEDEY